MNARLRIYVGADQRYEHLQLHEWLLHKAQLAGLPGATAVESIAGFGPNNRSRALDIKKLLDSLSADKTVVVDFVGPREQLELFLEQTRGAGALDRSLVLIEGIEVVQPS